MADVPSNAPAHCPGTSSQEAGKADACAGCPNQAVCASAPKGPDPDLAAIAERMSAIKHKILVLSGKGGVGKSTFAAQLAFALATQGKEVGLLDIDICGPSVPKMLGLEGQEVHQSALGWSPVYVEENLAVMSIGFMLPNPNDAVIWRGPRKNSLIKQFLKDVHWGALDYLVVDAPPGTSDEHISIAQFLQADPAADGAVIVTTPQEVAIIDVRKEVSFCRKVGLRVLGVVENMAGLRQRLDEVRFLEPTSTSPASPASAAAVAASDGAGGATGQQAKGSASGAAAGGAAGRGDVTARVLEALRAAGFEDPGALLVAAEVFAPAGGGAAHMCKQLGLTLLGQVPLDPHLGRAAEEGRAVFEAPAQAQGKPAVASREVPSAAALQGIVARLVGSVETGPASGQ